MFLAISEFRTEERRKITNIGLIIKFKFEIKLEKY